MKIYKNNIWNIEISLITYWELQKGNITMTFLVINRNKSKRITTQFRQGNTIMENPTETISSLMWGQLLLVKFLTATKILMIISKLVSWTPFWSRQHVKRRLKIYCIDSKIAQLDGMPFSLSISKLWDNTLKDLWPTSVISHSKLDFFHMN